MIYKVLPLLYKEYSRLASLNDQSALALQKAVALNNFGRQIFENYESDLLSKKSFFLDFWKETKSSILNAQTNDIEICTHIGSLDRKFISLAEGSRKITAFDFSKQARIVQIEFKLYYLRRYCISYPEAEKRMSLRNNYILVQEGNVESMDEFDKLIFAEDQYLEKLQYKNKSDLIYNITKISEDIEQFMTTFPIKNF